MSDDQDRLTTSIRSVVDRLRRNPRRAMWLGLLIQAVALGVTGWAVWHETKRETAAMEATKYLWRLGWHDTLHRMPWIAVLVGCLIVYMGGALIFAMRFAPDHAGVALGLFLGLLVGVALLGAGVLVLGLVVAALHTMGLDVGGANWDSIGELRWPSRRKPRSRGHGRQTPP